MGLVGQVLEFGKVCLEAVVFLSGSLFQVVELVSGGLLKMVGVEHVAKGFLYSLPVLVCRLDGWIGEFLQPDSCKVFSTSLIHFV